MNVTGQGERTVDRNGIAYGSSPTPGIKLRRAESGAAKMCTLGPIVAPATLDAARGVLTAGHCATTSGDQSQLLQTDAGGANTKPLGPATGAVDGTTADGYSIDAAVVWTTASVPTESTRVARTWPVAGAFTVAGTRKLAVGTQSA
ncbi:hypothetical protein [Gordonia sp. CPCC 205333]|uniref:hypothetical protein n=1 Tax=Gordonia sp. CPCC 205333 TaxID=3140790 RepID=UPI003AF33CA9